MMTRQRLQSYFFLLLLTGGLLLLFLIFRPYLTPLVLAAVFAVIAHPVYRQIRRALGGYESLAALVTTLLIVVIVFAPLLFFGFRIFQEARGLYDQGVILALQNRLAALFPSLAGEVSRYLQQALGWFVQHVGTIFSSIAQLILYLFLSLLALYYLLRDGERLVARVIRLSPLQDTYDRLILTRLHTAVTSVLLGSLVIAILQGISTGIGLAVFGVPNPALWGSLTVIAALIPTIGTALISVPAILYLFLHDQLLASLGLLLWATTAVGLLDNLLGPKLIERGIKIHPLLILLSVLGSIRLFGAVGFLLGPLALSLCVALLELYPLVVLSNGSRTRAR